VLAEAQQRERWNHTAQLLALLHNIHRDPEKSRELAPRDFHPFAEPLEIPKISGKDLSILRDVFVKHKDK